MSYHKNLDLLPELQQIEAIIAQNKHHYLSYEILNHIPYQNQSFPIYALSLGSKQADAPRIAFVGGVHGLERIGTQVVLTFLQTLLNRLR
ncbi:MAG: hypothetical protein GQ475_06365 [Methylococcaceae bacterium]|nr:hypothetical protein [Methylococcaceae bacterium]